MSNIIGRYKLISHGTYDSQLNFTPTSNFCKGELIYSSENNLSVLIFFKEKIESNRDLLAYTGSFEIIDSSNILHQISICSNSGRNGGTEKRKYIFEQDKLILSVDLEENKKFEAVWLKI